MSDFSRLHRSLLALMLSGVPCAYGSAQETRTLEQSANWQAAESLSPGNTTPIRCIVITAVNNPKTTFLASLGLRSDKSSIKLDFATSDMFLKPDYHGPLYIQIGNEKIVLPISSNTEIDLSVSLTMTAMLNVVAEMERGKAMLVTTPSVTSVVFPLLQSEIVFKAFLTCLRDQGKSLAD